MSPTPTTYPPAVSAAIANVANGTGTVAQVQQAINAAIAGGATPIPAPTPAATVNGTTLATPAVPVAVATPATGFNPLSAWVNDPLISDSFPVGIWEAAIGAVGLFFLFFGGKKR